MGLLFLFYLICLSCFGQSYKLDILKTGSTIESFNLSNGLHIFMPSTVLPNDISHVIFQVHSPTHNVTVCESSQPSYSNSVNGTHVGLVTITSKNKAPNWYVFNRYLGAENLTVFIMVTLYTFNDPIPGACNMERPMTNDPNVYFIQFASLKTMYGAVRTMTFSLGGLWRNGIDMLNCGDPRIWSNTRYHLYQLSIGPADYSLPAQLSILRDLATPENVLANGYHMWTYQPASQVASLLPRKTLVDRAGRGLANVLIMERINNGSADSSTYASYVIDVNYGSDCGPHIATSKNACFVVSSWTWRFVVALSSILALVVCLAGHRVFHFSVFFMSWLVGAFLCAVLLMGLNVQWENWMVALVMLVGAGLPLAIVGVLLWYCLETWNFSLLFHTAALSFLTFCSIVFFTPLHNLSIWSVLPSYAFVLILIILLLIFELLFSCCLPLVGSILSSALVGSFIVVFFASSLFVQGTLFPQIFLDNLLRLVALKDDLAAVFYVEYRFLDAVFIAIWLLLSVIGIITQKCLSNAANSNRPRPQKKREYSLCENLPSIEREQWPPQQSCDGVYRSYHLQPRIDNERTPLLHQTDGRLTGGYRTPPPAYD